MVQTVRGKLSDGPLEGQWRTLLVDASGRPPEFLRISGLLGVAPEIGGVHRCVIYRRILEESEGMWWLYMYDHDEPYVPFPSTGSEG